MNTFEINKILFVKRYFLTLFSGKTGFSFIIHTILCILFCIVCDSNDLLTVLLICSPFIMWCILWSLWISYKYLYKIEICDNEIIFYLQVFNKIQIHKRDISNTRVIFYVGDSKSRSSMSFGGKVKGYFYKESLRQWFVCEWGKKYKDFAKFLIDNGVWNNLKGYIK